MAKRESNAQKHPISQLFEELGGLFLSERPPSAKRISIRVKKSVRRLDGQLTPAELTMLRFAVNVLLNELEKLVP